MQHDDAKMKNNVAESKKSRQNERNSPCSQFSSEEYTKLMLDASPLCSQIWDTNLVTIDCNEAAVKLYGFKSKKEYINRFITDCSPEYQPDGQSSIDKAVMLVQRTFKEGRSVFDWMHQMPDGAPMPAEITLVRVHFKGDYYVIGYTRDLRDITRLEAEVEKIYYDSLTGIYNRRYLDKHLSRLVKTLSRTDGNLSFMMIDIDHFKNYNDSYGHDEGDKCLRIVAATLSKSIARADDFVARYGGEEFAVVLPNADEFGAHIVANRLLENIRKLRIKHEYNDAAAYVTISIGATSGRALRMFSGDDFIKRADTMLYNSKQNGRNRYSFKSLTDISSQPVLAKDALETLQQSKEMTDVLKDTAISFLSQRESSFEDMMTAGVRLIADLVDMDRLTVWRNIRKPDGLHLSQVYRWDRDSGGTTHPDDKFTDISYAESASEWEGILAKGGTINGPVRLMPEKESEVLKSYGVVSAFVAPVFIDNRFWGFVLFADLHSERFFDDTSTEIMRSAAALFSNAVIRAELENKLAEAEEYARLMLDTIPICCQLWGKDLKTIDCNKAAVKRYGFNSKQEYIDGFIESCSPEHQPDGKLSNEKAVSLVKEAFESGYSRFNWMHQKPDGTLLPSIVTLIRVSYKGGYIVVGYTEDIIQ